MRPQGRENLVLVDGTRFPQTSIARVRSEFRWSTDCFALDYPENRTAARLVLYRRRYNSRQRALEPTIRILVNLRVALLPPSQAITPTLAINYLFYLA